MKRKIAFKSQKLAKVISTF